MQKLCTLFVHEEDELVKIELEDITGLDLEYIFEKLEYFQSERIKDLAKKPNI